MFTTRRRGNLGTKLFVVAIIALFIYGYVLDDDSLNNLRNINNDNNQIAEENTNPSQEENNHNNPPIDNANTNPTNPTDKVITVGTKLICKTYDEESNNITTSEMNVPDEMINLSLEDARKYINNNFNNWIINEMNENYIEVYQTSNNESSFEPYFLVQEENGKVYIFEFDESGNKKIIQETNINYDFLSEVDQEYFSKGIIKYDLEKVYELLQDFES